MLNFVYETNSQTIGYQNWNPGEPNDWGPGEDCTEIHVGNGKWNDMPCSEQMSVVCENPGKSRIDYDSKCKRTRQTVKTFSLAAFSDAL